MKIARLLQSDKETFGFINGDKVATKDQIIYETAIPLPHNIKDFLFDGWYNEVQDKLENLSYNKRIDEFEILTPIPNPPKIICLAFNYGDHAKEQNLHPPKEPVIVMKPRTTLCGTNSNIICPKFVTKLDYEIELAVIIGKNCKNIEEKDVQDAIFGYTIFNDVSARDIQMGDKQFTRGKGFDTFAPCGPWITTTDEIKEPQNLKMQTKVNGEIRQNSSTSKMFLTITSIISKLSKVMTLEKGDIISTGTPAGVVLGNPDMEYLKDGDIVEMEIENLGTLTNTIKFI